MAQHRQQAQEETSPCASKSDHKRTAANIRQLGVELGALTPAQRERLPLDDSIRAALDELDRIKSANARQRQFGFIGRLLRKDPEHIEILRHCMELMKPGSEAWQRHRHQIEAWRSRLLQEGAEGKAALATFSERFPQTDIQTVRQLIRNTLREKDDNKKSERGKKLLRYINQLCLAQQTAELISTASTQDTSSNAGEDSNDV